VTTSSLAALNLVEDGGITVVAKITGRVLTVMVLRNGRLKLVRCLEVHANDVAEIRRRLVPDVRFISKTTSGPKRAPAAMRLAERMEAARHSFRASWVWRCSPCVRRSRRPAKNNAGLLGYLRSVSRDN